MRLAIMGAGGRMGRALILAVQTAKACTIAGAIERDGSPLLGQDVGTLVGIAPLGVAIEVDPLSLFIRVDGILDFTSPDASVTYAGLAAQARIVHVIGTTGFSTEQDAKLAAAARHATIIKSGNMSLGINLLAALTEKVAKALGPEFDIEIVEMHHRHKVDAPSGTALLLGDAAAAGREVDRSMAFVKARDGVSGERADGAIGFASLRGGSVVGDHTVIFAGQGERIEITHRAEDRQIFARGAVQAALWGRGREPGLYSMRDVLGL